jgi:hypothetical protein
VRPARSVVALLAVLGGACLVGSAPPAAAVDVEVGSWWQANTGAGSPTPPTVQPGQAWFSSAVTGPTAVTAVRFTTNPRLPPPPLVLHISSAQPDATGSVVACPATSAWKVATAGPWADRPTADCTKGRVQGITSTDGKTMTFDLSILDLTPKIDLVLSPTESKPPTPSVPSAPVAVPVAVPVTTPPYYATFDIVGAFAPPEVEAAAAAPEPAAPSRTATAPSAAALEPAPVTAIPTSVDIARGDVPSGTRTVTAPTALGPAQVAAPVANPAIQRTVATPKDRPGPWRVAVAVVLVVAALEATRRAGTKPLGGLKAPQPRP